MLFYVSAKSTNKKNREQMFRRLENPKCRSAKITKQKKPSPSPIGREPRKTCVSGMLICALNPRSHNKQVNSTRPPLILDFLLLILFCFALAAVVVFVFFSRPVRATSEIKTLQGLGRSPLRAQPEPDNRLKQG